MFVLKSKLEENIVGWFKLMCMCMKGFCLL